jgi:hypothetical protein
MAGIEAAATPLVERLAVSMTCSEWRLAYQRLLLSAVIAIGALGGDGDGDGGGGGLAGVGCAFIVFVSYGV